MIDIPMSLTTIAASSGNGLLPDPEATGAKSSEVVMSLARLGLGSSKDSILFLFIFLAAFSTPVDDSAAQLQLREI